MRDAAPSALTSGACSKGSSGTADTRSPCDRRGFGVSSILPSRYSGRRRVLLTTVHTAPPGSGEGDEAHETRESDTLCPRFPSSSSHPSSPSAAIYRCQRLFAVKWRWLEVK